MGFTFNGVHSETFGIRVKRATTALKPSKRVYRAVIGGRDGTYDFSDGAYANIVITFECDCRGAQCAPLRRDDVALWLSERGELALDSEPGRVYTADCFSEIPLAKLGSIGQFSLAFNCFPFSMSPPRQVDALITQNGQETPIRMEGTARTPCVITIRNVGTRAVKNVRFTHRKEVRQ